MISARANGSIVLVNGTTSAKFRHDKLQASQNSFQIRLGNFTPSSNNYHDTLISIASIGEGRINSVNLESKLHCCYEIITEGPKFPSENRFGSRMLIQSKDEHNHGQWANLPECGIKVAHRGKKLAQMIFDW